MSGRTWRVPHRFGVRAEHERQLHRLQTARPVGEHAQAGDLWRRLPAAQTAQSGGHTQPQHQRPGAGPRRQGPRTSHMTEDRQALGQTCAPGGCASYSVRSRGRRQRLKGSMVPSRSARGRPRPPHGRRSHRHPAHRLLDHRVLTQIHAEPLGFVPGQPHLEVGQLHPPGPGRRALEALLKGREAQQLGLTQPADLGPRGERPEANDRSRRLPGQHLDARTAAGGGSRGRRCFLRRWRRRLAADQGNRDPDQQQQPGHPAQDQRRAQAQAALVAVVPAQDPLERVLQLTGRGGPERGILFQTAPGQTVQRPSRRAVADLVRGRRHVRGDVLHQVFAQVGPSNGSRPHSIS